MEEQGTAWQRVADSALEVIKDARATMNHDRRMAMLAEAQTMLLVSILHELDSINHKTSAR